MDTVLWSALSAAGAAVLFCLLARALARRGAAISYRETVTWSPDTPADLRLGALEEPMRREGLRRASGTAGVVVFTRERRAPRSPIPIFRIPSRSPRSSGERQRGFEFTFASIPDGGSLVTVAGRCSPRLRGQTI